MAQTPSNTPNAAGSSTSSGHSHQIPGYQMLAKLGAGATATVYKARQLSLDRTVAIKVLSKKHSSNPEYVKRLYSEGRAAAKLNHPNIVGALDVGKAGELHYFVMEYVEGASVYEELMDEVRLDEERAAKIIVDTARGLAAAHKAGIIHRDVKPQNIMLTADGMVKLADMGLARMESDVAEAGKSSGTPYYVAPEQIRNQPDLDFRADIYSLGATFYFMITGKVPFDGATARDVLRKQLHEKLVPPNHVDSRLGEASSQIIQVCMAKKAQDRYDSTEDLVKDLEALIAEEIPLRAQAKLDAFAEREQATQAAAGDDLPIAPPETDDTPPPPTRGKKPAAAPTAPDPDAAPGDGTGDEAFYSKPTTLTQQKLFWVALAGWAAAVLFLILWISK